MVAALEANCYAEACSYGIEVDDDAADIAAMGKGCDHGPEVRDPMPQRSPRSLRVLLTGAVARKPSVRLEPHTRDCPDEDSLDRDPAHSPDRRAGE